MKHNVISVSGGKDSTALLLLAKDREAENLQAVFADTGNEHPQTYEYIQYLSDTVHPVRTIKADFSEQIKKKRDYVRNKWPEKGVPEEKIQRALAVLHPTGIPFLDLCIWKGIFPDTFFRFCSKMLKRDVLFEQAHMPLTDLGDDVWSWQGVRADESPKRANLPELEEVGGGLWNYRPILQWTADQCFEMHDRHGIKPNPLYTQGMARVGCMPCIHERKDSLLEISKRFPEVIERIAEWERIVSEANPTRGSTFFSTTKIGVSSENISLATGGIEANVEWAKTSRGRWQYDMFRINDEPSTCSSIYGLCE